MNVLKLYRFGLGADVVLAILGSITLDEGEISGPLLITAFVHSIVASLIYYRGKRGGGFSGMDRAFLAAGQLGILLFLLFLFIILWRHYLGPMF